MHKDFNIIDRLGIELKLLHTDTKKREKTKRQLDERLEMLRI